MKAIYNQHPTIPRSVMSIFGTLIYCSAIKLTKPSRPLEAIVYHKFNVSPKLCVAECAKLYIEIRN